MIDAARQDHVVGGLGGSQPLLRSVVVAANANNPYGGAMFDMFMQCGAYSYGIALLVLVGLPLAMAGIVMGLKRSPGTVAVCSAALVVGVLAAGVGVLGWFNGLRVVDSVLEAGAVSESQREQIRTAGYAEAGQCRKLGAIGASPVVVLAAVGIGLAMLRAKAVG